MIVLRITSGLGNQMFQYAFYTLLEEKYKDTEILCDTRWFNCNHEGREYELERIFSGVEGSSFEIKKASLMQTIKLSGKVPNLFNGGTGKAFEKFRRYPNRLLKNNLLEKRKPYILDQLDGYLPDKISNIDDIHSESENTGISENKLETLFYNKIMNLDTANDYFICGFFIEEKYYSQVMDEVKKRFIFPEITEEHNKKYAELITNSDSVSIHVRRGDYLSDLYKDKFLTLGREYYEGAVNYIKNEFPEKELKFFIFSDDEEFVKKEFDWLENKTIVTGNSGDTSYRDMQLMSLCSHNIIANSTFSQWGALLNRNEGHITVYPRVYMTDSDNEKKSLPGWIRL